MDNKDLFPKHKRAVCDVQKARFEELNMPFTTFKENTFNDSNRTAFRAMLEYNKFKIFIGQRYNIGKFI